MAKETTCKMVYSLHFEVLTFPDTIGSCPFHLSPATKIVFIINKTTKYVTRMEKKEKRRRKRNFTIGDYSAFLNIHKAVACE